MTAREIVANVAAIGGTIRATGSATLKIMPPAEGLPSGLLDDIHQHKPELLALLGPELPPAIDPATRRDVIAEQPNPPAYVAWLFSPTGKEPEP
jgi:hypothetical protein